MQARPDAHQKILFANKAATILCAVIFLFSLGIALSIDSVVLMLDSAGWLTGIITGILYDRVIKTVQKPPSARYHFGYAKFEPMSLVLEAMLIIGSCYFTLKMGIQDILHPDEVDSYGLAIVLTLCTGLASVLMASYQRLMGQKYASPILRANGVSWFVDAVMAFGICAGFLLARWLSESGQAAAAAYVDPVMGICMALLLLPSPLKMLREYVAELLDENPGGRDEQVITQLLEEFQAQRQLAAMKNLRIRKAGAQYFIDVCYIADDSACIEGSLQAVSALHRALQQTMNKADLSVRFELSRGSASAPGDVPTFQR